MNVPDGNYTLQFFNPGIEISDQIISLKGGHITIKDFIINPDKSTASINYSTYQLMASYYTDTMSSDDTAQ